MTADEYRERFLVFKIQICFVTYGRFHFRVCSFDHKPRTCLLHTEHSLMYSLYIIHCVCAVVGCMRKRH